MSIKRKVKMMLAYDGTTGTSLASVFGLTEQSMRNKLSLPIEISTLLQLADELGWKVQLEGPHNAKIVINYQDILDDQLKYEKGPHKEYKG